MEKNATPTPAAPKLCMILKGYPRISETFISNEILLLESLGFSIHIISMRHPREAFTHGSVKAIRASVDYLPSTILEHIGPLLYHNLLLAARQPASYFKALKKAGTRWLRTRKSATIKHLLQAGYLVHKYLPGSGIVHFQAHFAHSPTSVALFSSMLSGIPFSFFAHAKDIYTSDLRQLAEKISMARFVVTCTRYNKQYLDQFTPDCRTPVFCVYHGINLDYFSPEDALRVPAEPYALLTVARMTEKKGIDTIFRALAILKKQGVRFTYHLIGEGDDKPRLLQLIQELGLEQHVCLCGTLAHEQVIAYYAAADLFVLGCQVAANGDRDGIPNVMAESMAMKLPVVATTVSGLPEFLTHMETGLAVPPKDPDAMAGAIHRLLTDQTLRRKVVDQASSRIRQQFNNQKLIHTLAGIYADQIPALGIRSLPSAPGDNFQ